MIGDVHMDCPLCHCDVPPPQFTVCNTQTVRAKILTDNTWHRHVAEHHTDLFNSYVREQIAWNETGIGMPRDVDGTFLYPGQHVGEKYRVTLCPEK